VAKKNRKQKTIKQLKKMKKLTLLLILGFGVLMAMAQEESKNEEISTIFSKSRSNGGYGAISFSYTQLDGKDAFMMGARGSWIIDHSFAIGLGGCGFVNDLNHHHWMDNDLTYNLAGGYGGIYLEPIIGPRLPVHISFPVLFGVGGITNIANGNWENNWMFDNGNEDEFLIMEPAVELEFNMTRHMRLAGSFGYRFTSDIEMDNTNPDVLEGFNVGIVLKFGKF
jgi:hypothetical protein